MGERDSGDEYIQKTVDADQDVGYEAAWLPIPDGTIDLFSNRQLEELNKFMYIHEQIDKVAEEAEKGNPIGWFLRVSENGKAEKKDLIFMMDHYLLNTMHHIADNMYHGHDDTLQDGTVIHIPGFIDDPLMKEAADNFLNGRFYDKRQAREFEVKEFQAWWDQS